MTSYQKEAKGLLEEFKAFALKGNVVDLAVAVVIGGAFGKIVSSLVDNIIVPLTSLLSGGVDLSDLSLEIGPKVLTYGAFLQSVLDFVIISASIFAAIKIIRSLERKEEQKPESQKTVEPSEEVKLLREIRDSLSRR